MDIRDFLAHLNRGEIKIKAAL